MARQSKYMLCSCAAPFSTTGGQAYEDFSCPGLTAMSPVVASLNEQGASPVTIVAAFRQSDGVARVTFSADPGDDHKLSIIWCPM